MGKDWMRMEKTLDAKLAALKKNPRGGEFILADAKDADTPIGLSAVLVGAGDGGLDRATCVQAMLQAANEAQGRVRKVRVAQSDGRASPRLMPSVRNFDRAPSPE